jgi:hypothetical protein
MRRVHLPVLALAVAGAAAAAAWGVGPRGSMAFLPSFVQIGSGPAGGAIWQGLIPNGTYPRSHRVSLLYLPPDFSPDRRYPMLFVLHGIRGSPYSIANGLRFADFADNEIVAGRMRPFLAVMPPAGLTERFEASGRVLGNAMWSTTGSLGRNPTYRAPVPS